MNGKIRRSVSWVAIYVIALTTILSAFSAPRPASAAFDPFSIICHSGPQDASPADTGPAAPASLPNHACDHCTLCNAAPTAAVTFDGVVVGILAPAKPLRVLRPTESIRHDDIGSSPRQAQGPPSTT